MSAQIQPSSGGFRMLLVCHGVLYEHAPVTEPLSKVGGNPVLYEPIEWPTCRKCGRQMHFLAQLRLDTPMALLAWPAMAYLFTCPDQYGKEPIRDCRPWEPGGGANAIIIQQASDHPRCEPGKPAYPERLLAFRTASEVLPDDPDDPLIDLPAIFPNAMPMRCTKIGGAPTWLQRRQPPACPCCGRDTVFFAQLAASLDAYRPSIPELWPDADCILPHKEDLPFGDGGMAYVFVCASNCGPNGAALLWQTPPPAH